MFSLPQLLDHLLLQHDCVVLPTFGGFITHYEEAAAQADGSIAPPRRTVRFNQELTTDDGLLQHAYMTAYDADYVSAQKQMLLDIAQLRDELSLRGSCLIDGIGRLSIDLAGKVAFEALEAGIATPHLYALESISIEPVEGLLRKRELEKQLQQTTIVPIVSAGQDDQTVAEHSDTKGDSVIVRIPRRWVDIGAAAAAAAILFCLVSLPSLHRADSAAEQTIVAGASPVAVTTARPQTPVVVKEKEPAKEYTIVLACQVSERNANLYMQHLAEKGFTDSRFDTSGNFPRILYSAYTDETEATNALRQLRTEASEFRQAWVTKL